MLDSDDPYPLLRSIGPRGCPRIRQIIGCALSLAPEDEARQIARLAFGQGLRRSITIRPDNDWGRRMEAALQASLARARWHCAYQHRALGRHPPSEQISQALGGLSLRRRIAAVEEAFEAPVAARARRYQDFDCIFLLTQGPGDARSLRPLLVFHYSGDVPVFASSSINSGDQNNSKSRPQWRDFCRNPCCPQRCSTDRFTQLKALGHDAITALDHRQQALSISSPLHRVQQDC